MAYSHISDISYADLYDTLSGHSTMFHANGGRDGYSTMTWHYYDEKEETTSEHPVLWGVGGLIVGALLMGILWLIFRKRSKGVQPVILQEAPSREELLRKRALALNSVAREEQDAVSTGEALSGPGSSESSEKRLVEVRQADAIPGETMAELAVRVQGCLGREGVRVEIHDIGKILGAYASVGSVRIAAVEEPYSPMVQRAAKALSDFFCVSLPRNPDPAPDYMPADASVPPSYRTEVHMTRLELADRLSYGGGMNWEIFRGILREAEEEYFLSEEVWKHVDVLLDRYTKDWVSPARHLMVRTIENISTCLLAVGVDPEEALDYALYKALFLKLTRKSSRKIMAVLGETFEEQFQGHDLPQCRLFLEACLPHPQEPETPVLKNQTIHGGEYESV